MDEAVIHEYVEKIPIEIREPIMALNNDQRWALFIALTLDKEMYFNEIKKLFKANPYTIDTNLKALVASGLIAKKVKNLGELGKQEKTYYQSTELGRELIFTLCDVGLPEPQIKARYVSTRKEEGNWNYKSVIRGETSRVTKNYVTKRFPIS